MEVSELEDIVIRVHEGTELAQKASKALRDAATGWAAGFVKSSKQLAVVCGRTADALDKLDQHLSRLETDIAELEVEGDGDEG